MDHKIKITVVEDEMIIGAKISMLLSQLGYEVTGILPRGEEALLHVAENNPDIVLLDIQLKGKLDGIETATLLQQRSAASVIYLTANTDDATFNRAKSTKPSAFISKPFKQLDLQRAIELTISRMVQTERGAAPAVPNDEHFILSDRIFIRYKDKMLKLLLSDILFIEADRNYSKVLTKDKEYLLSTTLKNIEEKLPAKVFQRVHRSYLINLNHVDEVVEGSVMILGKAVPLGEGMKAQLMQHLRTL